MSRKIKLILTVSLLINIVAIGLAARRGYYMYQDYNNSSSKPIPGRQVVYNLFPITNNDIVFIGDSQTEGFDTEDFFSAIKIKNRGISGDVTAGVYSRIGDILNGHPKKIFIEIGTNDIYVHGNNTDTCLLYISKIIDLAKKETPNTEVYINSIPPLGIKFKDITERYNAQLSAICKKTGAIFIDIYTSFSYNGNLKKQYDCGDGLHFSAAAYVEWAQILKPYLN